MATPPLIRFDKADFVFNPADFVLTDPTEYEGVSYKPKTSRILYKGGKCSIKFPKQFGYGLSEFKDNDTGKKSFTFTYLKKAESDEEKRFIKFIEDFDPWLKGEVKRIAKSQRETQGKRVLSEKLAKDLEKDDSLIKPFFIFPKDKATKMKDTNKTKRHYIKFKADDEGRGSPKCDVYNHKFVRIDSKNILSTETDKKTGDYVIEVILKGVFYDIKEDYSAFLQTEGSVVVYKKSSPRNPKELVGDDFEDESDEQEENEEVDPDAEFEAKMMEKVNLVSY